MFLTYRLWLVEIKSLTVGCRPIYEKFSLQTRSEIKWHRFIEERLNVYISDYKVSTTDTEESRTWYADFLEFSNGVVLSEFSSPLQGFLINSTECSERYFSFYLFDGSVSWYEKVGESSLPLGGIVVFDSKTIINFRTDVDTKDIVVLNIPYSCFESYKTIEVLKSKKQLIYAGMIKEIFSHLTIQDQSVYRKINTIIDIIEYSVSLEAGNLYKRIIRAIKDNCRDIGFNLSTLCEFCCIPHRVVREQFEINRTSFLNELNKVRVDILAEEIASFRKSNLVEVCRDCGFNSYANALKQFKKYKKCTFTEYKRLIRS